MTTETNGAREAVAKAFKRMHRQVCYPDASDGEAEWAADEILKAIPPHPEQGQQIDEIEGMLTEAMSRFWDAEGGTEQGVRAVLSFAKTVFSAEQTKGPRS